MNNTKKDILKILFVFIKAGWILIKNKRRLDINKEQIIFFLSQLIIQLRSVSFWDNYFSKSVDKPVCVITEFDRNNISSVLVSCARKYNITTITLTHGVICDYGFTPVLADYIFCWGKFQRDQLLNQGVPADRILITGNPMIKSFRHQFLSPSRIIKICFAISPEFQNRSMVTSFISAIENIEQISGLIKLHPSLNKRDFEWVKDLSSNISVMGSEDISNNELFEDIDLLVIRQSGIANEALSSGVPVVIFEPDGKENFSQMQRELIGEAGCKAANNKEELLTIFKDFLADPNLYKINSLNAGRKYLNALYQTMGEESIQSMIAGINRLTA